MKRTALPANCNIINYREKNETTNQTPNSDNKINRSAIPSRPKGSIAKKNIGI